MVQLAIDYLEESIEGKKVMKAIEMYNLLANKLSYEKCYEIVEKAWIKLFQKAFDWKEYEPIAYFKNYSIICADKLPKYLIYIKMPKKYVLEYMRDYGCAYFKFTEFNKYFSIEQLIDNYKSSIIFTFEKEDIKNENNNG